jgi:hypothetical protein
MLEIPDGKSFDRGRHEQAGSVATWAQSCAVVIEQNIGSSKAGLVFAEFPGTLIYILSVTACLACHQSILTKVSAIKNGKSMTRFAPGRSFETLDVL